MENQESLSARQLLVLGLLGNLTAYRGRPPTRKEFVDYLDSLGVERPEGGVTAPLIDAGLLEQDDKERLVRRYWWEPASNLPNRKLRKGWRGPWGSGKVVECDA